jgi:hypothetical protein
LVFAFGCPETNEGMDASRPDAEAQEDATTEDIGAVDAEPSDDGGMQLPGPGLAGFLRDEAEAPIGFSMVLACLATTCYFGETDQNGHFYFVIEPPAEIALKTLEDLSITPRRGASLAPVKLVDSSLVDVGSIYAPNLPTGDPIGPAALDPQTLEGGDGLQITLNRADLRPRLGDVIGDLAARLIPEAHIPPIPELGSEEIVAVYALHPFGAHSTSPMAVRAASTLTAGTVVRFRSISEIDGLLSPPAMGTADGSFVSTDPGEGIEELSWLVISR